MNNFQEAQRLGMNGAHDADRSITFGEITQAAIAQALDRFYMFKKDADEAAQLLAAAGIDTIKDKASLESATEREKRHKREDILQCIENVAPEKAFDHLCIWAAQRAIDRNQAYWVAQQIANAACTLAVNAACDQKEADGLMEHVDITKDELESFTGQYHVPMGSDNTSPRYETENPFSRCADPGTIEGTYENWFQQIELKLMALAAAAKGQKGEPMRCGQHSRWDTAGGYEWVQIIESYTARLDAESSRRKDRPSEKRTIIGDTTIISIDTARKRAA